jgi:lysozyme
MNVRDLISKHEGRVEYAYQDSLGYWTIGVGHLIDKRRGGAIPESIIDALLDYDIDAVKAELFKELPDVAKLDEVRQAVLIDMAFNLGVSGLLGFHNFLLAVHKADYAAASVDMLNSRWATQVGHRAIELSHMMKTGEWNGQPAHTHVD